MIDDDPLPFDSDPHLDSIWIDCYVRADPSPVLHRQIEHIRDRLRRLQETPVVADFQVKQWPPRQEIAVDTAPTETTRDEIVASFEAWAEKNGYALTPAFQRLTIPAEPGGSDGSGPRERLRVPQIALALYDDELGTGYLEAVVPYTDTTDDAKTYTVPRWLTEVEELARSQGLPTSETVQG